MQPLNSRIVGFLLAVVLFPAAATAQDETPSPPSEPGGTEPTTTEICPGVAVEHVFRGRQRTFRLDRERCQAQVPCPEEARCEVLTSSIVGTGGFREWCGCPGTEESLECHTAVVHQPPLPGRLPAFNGELDCFFTCPNEGEECCAVLVSSEIERRGRRQPVCLHLPGRRHSGERAVSEALAPGNLGMAREEVSRRGSVTSPEPSPG